MGLCSSTQNSMTSRNTRTKSFGSGYPRALVTCSGICPLLILRPELIHIQMSFRSQSPLLEVVLKRANLGALLLMSLLSSPRKVMVSLFWLLLVLTCHLGVHKLLCCSQVKTQVVAFLSNKISSIILTFPIYLTCHLFCSNCHQCCC